jgi:hypothetical protein
MDGRSLVVMMERLEAEEAQIRAAPASFPVALRLRGLAKYPFGEVRRERDAEPLTLIGLDH